MFLQKLVARSQVFFILINDACLMHLAEAGVFSILLHWDLFAAVAVDGVFAHFLLNPVIDVPLAFYEWNRAARALHLVDSLKLTEAQDANAVAAAQNLWRSEDIEANWTIELLRNCIWLKLLPLNALDWRLLRRDLDNSFLPRTDLPIFLLVTVFLHLAENPLLILLLFFLLLGDLLLKALILILLLLFLRSFDLLPSRKFFLLRDDCIFSADIFQPLPLW